MDRALTWRPLGGALPTWRRSAFLAGIGLLAALILGAGGWYWWEQQYEAVQAAFDRAFLLYRQAMAGAPDRLGPAVQALEAVAAGYPRHRVASLASYALGNLHYRARAYDKAVASYERAARTGRGDLVGVSQLGLGYAWEGRGDPGRALAIYQEALRGRDARDPFYGEFLLGMARTQVTLNRPADAKATYGRFLKDLPTSPQAEDVKARLARLEEARTP